MAGRELRLTVYSLFALSKETTIETVMGATTATNAPQIPLVVQRKMA